MHWLKPIAILIKTLSKEILMRYLLSILLIIMSIALSSCSSGTDDLEIWLAEVKSQPTGKISPLPHITPYQTFSYAVSDKRDPFDNSVLRPSVEIHSTYSALRPDTLRTQGPLEKFPLDTLSMMGTIARQNSTWGLIQTPDKKIRRVREGDYLGQNFGRIDAIQKDRIVLTEIISDGMGAWTQRKASIAINTVENNSFD